MPDGGFTMTTLAALAGVPRWVAWRPEPRKGKLTKVPYAPDERTAKSDDPATWGTRAEAEACAARMPCPHGPGGVGLELGDHAGLALGGIDLDTCRDPATGAIEPWATEVIERFGSYAEVSPSGTGVKVFFAFDGADLPALRTAMGTPYGKQWKRPGGDHPPAIELYLGNRYFAVTDQRLDGAPAGLRLVPTDTVLWLIREAGPAFVERDRPASGGEGRTRRPRDGSRSARAFRIAREVKRGGGSFRDFLDALGADPLAAEWAREKGNALGGRELRRAWERAGRNEPAWLQACQKTRDGDPRGNLFNVMVALREDPELRELFRYDEMQRAPLIADPSVPGGLRPVTDADVSRLQERLQMAGLETLSKDVAHQAVALRAEECRFHPVRDYLNGLRWDREHRVHGWLHTYLGAEYSEYTKRIGTMFLVAMVARVFEPGCKADYMMVLEGPQGAGKSSACRVLGDPWFSDCIPDLDRDAVRVAQHLRGKWLIEIAEMSAMNRAESAALKAFITRPVEIFTPKYARLEVHEPRQCVFIGTTNKAAYLRDETGGRRFWPVKVGMIDIDALARDRDQLLAEAVHLYRQGTRWWPDGDFEEKHIRPEQEARYEADAWEEAVAAWLDGEDQVTVLDVARQALFFETPRLGTHEQRRISAILERLGWAKGVMGKDGRPQLGQRGPKGERFWVKVAGND